MSFAPPSAGAIVVLDTNIVLDLWVFADPVTDPLRAALESGGLRWHGTAVMRDELARVLDYPHLAARLRRPARGADAVLAAFDRWVQPVAPAPKAPWTCKDPDDQKFIDLAVHLQATLLSKDRAVLCMARRLSRAGVGVARVWAPLTHAPVDAPVGA